MQKKEVYEINGILVFDKPEHMSSNFALQKVRASKTSLRRVLI